MHSVHNESYTTLYEPVGSMTVTVSNKQNMTMSDFFDSCVFCWKKFAIMLAIHNSVGNTTNTESEISNLYLRIGQYLNLNRVFVATKLGQTPKNAVEDIEVQSVQWIVP